MILVVGATGALGGLVTRDLLSAGHAVRVLVRSGSGYGPLVELGAQPVMGDLKDHESLERACAGVRTVITTANSVARGGTDTVESVDRRGNQSLIDAARAAGVDHFIFVSALGASPESPVPFLRAKGEAESHLRQSGMAWTILEPNMFMEVWIGMLVAAPVLQNRPVTLVGRGDHRHAIIAMRDVAAFAVEAVTNPAAHDALLVLGGPEARTWSQIVALTESIIGRPIDINYVAPGEPLPGLPAVAAELAASFETYETVLDTMPTAEAWGVRLTTIEECVRELLRPIAV